MVSNIHLSAATSEMAKADPLLRHTVPAVATWSHQGNKRQKPLHVVLERRGSVQDICLDQIDRQIDRWIDGGMNRQTDRQTDKQTDKQTD